jgi:hypothetical protein
MDDDDVEGGERAALVGNGLEDNGAIEIFLRVKPIANPSKKVEYDVAEGTVR